MVQLMPSSLESTNVVPRKVLSVKSAAEASTRSSRHSKKRQPSRRAERKSQPRNRQSVKSAPSRPPANEVSRPKVWFSYSVLPWIIVVVHS
jgi:hypothetical protein